MQNVSRSRLMTFKKNLFLSDREWKRKIERWWVHLPVWIRLWMFNDDFCVKRLLHISHWKGLSPVWIRIWMSKYGFRQNAAGHCTHWNGLPCTTCRFLCFVFGEDVTTVFQWFWMELCSEFLFFQMFEQPNEENTCVYMCVCVWERNRRKRKRKRNGEKRAKNTE